ncbi:50S rRNA methyltransferase [Kosmotoga arenicorallina S304]|uniref:Probable dual-specificity RNA methyltransferase RlmN n=1 Tax=Kosmotoga arenicorallina S304 TaxID=1453497 RepID=A0A176K1B3_9BACT|nr:23S rRNA (adenine(2503)-C(2))-methyltransferase RlmN [Kosmotoga arenicorallina]OAA30906.1 50S rRNA methyltransferase [Kosmotoga arenicorallina S304]
MKEILSLNYAELKNEILELGFKRFRAAQIYDWIHRKKVFDFDAMTNLSKSDRAFLKEYFRFPVFSLKDRQKAKDGTEKFLWELQDGEYIESVVIRHAEHITFCISTQVGCQLGCAFCATGLSGFKRNLSASEIVAQVLYMEKEIGEDADNIVFMGMGEPFLNSESLFKSIEVLHDEKGRNLGIRHFTISTAGIPDGIKRLADSGLDIRLSVSLHAAKDEKRSILMPINRRFPIEELFEALKYYQKKTGNRITFEYILIEAVNDSLEDADNLAHLLKGLKVFVNLIPVNPVIPKFQRPSPERSKAFEQALKKKGIETVLRAEKGTDIDAACGQLRRRQFRRENIES